MPASLWPLIACPLVRGVRDQNVGYGLQRIIDCLEAGSAARRRAPSDGC
jgi:hypothetical protein